MEQNQIHQHQIVDRKNGLLFTLSQTGEWLWKAITPDKVKRKVSEVPHFKVIDDIEKQNIKAFEQRLTAGVKDIAKYLVG